MPTLFILILLWHPTIQGTPVVAHMTYNTLEECKNNIKAMQMVFEIMQNDSAVMVCQPLSPASK